MVRSGNKPGRRVYVHAIIGLTRYSVLKKIVIIARDPQPLVAAWPLNNLRRGGYKLQDLIVLYIGKGRIQPTEISWRGDKKEKESSLDNSI
jgi:hypothetical protein